jgi:diguanylate cyclase (GGDEF)-like protein
MTPSPDDRRAHPLTSLRVLLIEDSEDDALLVIRSLSQAGYDLTTRRVDSGRALRHALRVSRWDLAIADYTMPGFSGTRALEIVREHEPDMPFIFVSGTIGEDVAVSAMRTGAQDYIMKGSLARLAPAVARELREAEVRRERTRANERVAYLAYHDQLTGLPNRALLHDRLRQAILTARRNDRPLALLLLDLDGFKEINDALGHHAGDRVLQQLASRLRGTLRESDTVARLGGDEFALLLPDADLAGAEMASRKVLADLEQPLMVDDRPLVVHGSLGIAMFPQHADSGPELLQKADVAMYSAKHDRAGYCVYAVNRDRHTEQRLTLLSSMRDAIDAQHFTLEYQPIVSVSTGLVTGVEALVRWNHPVQGRLQPKDFIHMAEQSGLITPLTTFAITRALAEWPLAPPFSVAVNVSPRTLHDLTFPDRVGSILSRQGAHPSTLALEITENVIMSNPERSTRCLKELHAMGIRLIVDDFGTGYCRSAICGGCRSISSRSTNPSYSVWPAAKTMRWSDRSSTSRTT